VLFEYCIYRKVYAGTVIDAAETRQFIFLVLASVFIAAAGYIINDYLI